MNGRQRTAMHTVLHSHLREQAHSQNQYWEVRDPQKWTFWPLKWTFLNLAILTLLQKPHFWSTLWLKVDLLADLGDCVAPCTPPGYGPVRET